MKKYFNKVKKYFWIDHPEELGMISICVVIVLAIAGVYTAIDHAYNTARINNTTDFNNNKVIYCGLFNSPVSKELGWKIDGDRVYNNTNSYDIVMSCK